MEKLSLADAYLMDNSEYIVFYVGSKVSDEFVQQVFGYHNFSDLRLNQVKTFYPVEGASASSTLWQLIEEIRYTKGGLPYAPVRLVLAGDNMEREVLESCLVEDSVDINKEFPYNDFLCMLHKLIRNK